MSEANPIYEVRGRSGLENPGAVARIRADFPILSTQAHGRPLVYLDNASTTQKPRAVIDAVGEYYGEYNSNVHRGVHYLSQRATEAYEGARARVQRHIHASELREVIFVRGATEGVNLVAESYGRKNVREGDEVLISTMEHHSNVVPWQILCEEKGAVLKVIPISDEGEILLEEYEKLLGPRTRLVSVVHLSNTLGTVNPVKRMIQMAHRQGVPVLLDGAQAIPHLEVDVQELDCDFYTFSAHKAYGPTGIGVVYGKAALLEEMPPYQGGGDMIRSVTFQKTIYNDLPFRFEAGTPNIAGAVGLGAALEYLDGVGLQEVAAHEQGLLRYAAEALSKIDGLTPIGTAREKGSVLSFVLDGVHPHDIGTILDQEGIAIRAGHHCTQPLMERLGITATARASFAFYNTREEVDAFIQALHKVIEVFR